MCYILKVVIYSMNNFITVSGYSADEKVTKCHVRGEVAVWFKKSIIVDFIKCVLYIKSSHLLNEQFYNSIGM